MVVGFERAKVTWLQPAKLVKWKLPKMVATSVRTSKFKGKDTLVDRQLWNMWCFWILFRKATAIFSLSPEVVPEKTRSTLSEPGIGREGSSHFHLVCGRCETQPIMESRMSTEAPARVPISTRGAHRSLITSCWVTLKCCQWDFWNHHKHS